jgi:sulfur carrier protein ThiS
VLIIYCFNDGSTISGTWTRYNTNPRTFIILINFSAVPPFDVLNEKWKITESEADRLALEIDTDCTEDLKILVFEKTYLFLLYI